jgi:phosphatidylglycerol:prolipoprotein diacylglycerol transferase
MHPELLRIGSFVLPTYGVLLACGFFGALWLVRRRAPAFGVSPDAAADVSIWLLLAGLVGAKILLVVVEGPSRYFSSWDGFVDLAKSAGVFYGGLIGGVIATFFLLRKHGLSFWTFVDIAAPSVALGQAVGRLGCFMAGCCWGRECHEAWAVTFTDPAANRNVGVPLGVPLHPTQLYEAVGTALLCVVLLKTERRRFPGETFARYLFGYALLRFTIEFFRGDPRGTVPGTPLSTSQFLALAGLLIASAIFAVQRRKGAPDDAAKTAASTARP